VFVRVDEARLGSREHVFVIPEVTGPERNWLLRHASFVWYPTSAEGFGLVPFEAAAFGTPTVAVDFGPISELTYARGSDTGRRNDHNDNADARELKVPRDQPSEFGDDVPILANGWDVDSLAQVALRFLGDPDLARRQAAALQAAGRHYRWNETADALVTLFRETLARPKR
jgi:glycosyltransferase involved in cell wall biosynthesis